MNFTIIGGNGFVGSAVVSHLRVGGNQVCVPERGDTDIFVRPLGHVIYAAGVTADFRTRPFDTLQAHVGHLAELLERATFDSLLYLSSARLYRHAESSREDAAVAVRSEDPEDFYDLTKLGGEALCHVAGRPNIRVARLSNVIGSDFRSANFVFDLIRAACSTGRIELRSALDSAKDYVLISDVARLLPEIAVSGSQRCYNVASGINIAHRDIVDVVTGLTNTDCTVVADAPRIASTPVDIQRVRSEFGFVPSDVLPEISILVNEYRNNANV